MNELQLQSFIIQALQAGIVTLALNPVPNVKQRYQPSTRGIPSAPTIYVQKTTDENFGFLKREYTTNETTLITTRSEEQPRITTFQVNATCIQDPTNTTQLTANDYVQCARYILQSDTARDFLRENNIQVLRVKSARQVQWKDDRGEFEADPSFDISVVHSDVITSTLPGSSIIIPNINQVNN